MVGKGNEEGCGNFSLTNPFEKITRLTAIRNGLKWTISASNGFEVLQMVSELVTKQCEALVGVGLEALHSRHILKP